MGLFSALRALRRRRHHQRGATAVEFALVLPLLIAVIFGAIDAGRLVISQCMLSYAVTAGARLAAASSTASFAAVQTAVANAVPLVNIPAASIHYQINAGAPDMGFGGRTTGDAFRVYTTCNYQPVMIGQLAARTLTASSQVIVR